MQISFALHVLTQYFKFGNVIRNIQNKLGRRAFEKWPEIHCNIFNFLANFRQNKLNPKVYERSNNYDQHRI